MNVIIKIIFLIVAIAIGVGLWELKRWWNYTFGYESQVIESICDEVKPEYLKHPEKCDDR